MVIISLLSSATHRERIVKRRANSDDKWSWYQVFSVAIASTYLYICEYSVCMYTHRYRWWSLSLSSSLVPSFAHSFTVSLSPPIFVCLFVWFRLSPYISIHLIRFILQSLSKQLCVVYSSSKTYTRTRMLLELVFSS